MRSCEQLHRALALYSAPQHTLLLFRKRAFKFITSRRQLLRTASVVKESCWLWHPFRQRQPLRKNVHTSKTRPPWSADPLLVDTKIPACITLSTQAFCTWFQWRFPGQANGMFFPCNRVNLLFMLCELSVVQDVQIREREARSCCPQSFTS